MRIMYFSLGCIFLVLGILGYILPLLPGTINLILAAGFFGKSFPRFEQWILDHPKLGPPVRDWRAEGSIAMKHKILAISMMWVSIILTCLTAPFFVGVFAVVIAIVTTIYLATRPTRIVAPRPAAPAPPAHESLATKNPVDAC